MIKELEEAFDIVADKLVVAEQREREIKALLIRAADALEKYTTYPIGMVMSVTLRETGRELIAQLRKAAE